MEEEPLQQAKKTYYFLDFNNNDGFNLIDLASDNIYKNILEQNDYQLLESDSAENNADLIIILVKYKDLCSDLFYNKLANSDFRKKDNEIDYQPKPIIFISAENIFRDYRNRKNDYNSYNHYNRQVNNLLEKTKYFNLDKRKGFLDSSIWHFYIPIIWSKDESNTCDDYKIDTFVIRFDKVIKKIDSYYDNKVYETVVAREYLEFQSRLLINSELKKIGSGHAKHITPFVFHSEAEMNFKANRKIKKLNENFLNTNNECHQITWNILIVDDYAKEKLKKSESESIDKSKKDLIEDILNDNNGVTDFNFNHISTESKALEDAIKKINYGVDSEDNKIQYDIILLDYLLEEESFANQNNTGLRKFGSDLFLDTTHKEIFKNKGPMGKFWIFPISAFNQAMLDKISNEGISRITEDWYLFDGANPISTPQLFRYNFYKLLELQLSQAIVTKEEIINDLIDSNFRDLTNTNIRAKARGLYGAFMHKFGLKEYLKLDAENGSAFATSICKLQKIEKYKQYSEFYEYVRKAIYLTGYGTHNDKIIVWELLKTIEKLLPEDKEKNIYRKDELKIFFNALISYLNQK